MQPNMFKPGFETHNKIPQMYPLCSIRRDRDQFSSTFFDAAAKCCTPVPIKTFQFWHYCEVDESNQATWLECVESTLGNKGGARCQAGDPHRPTATVIATPWDTPTPTPTPTPYSGYYSYLDARSVQQGGAESNLKVSVGGVVCALLLVSNFVLL